MEVLYHGSGAVVKSPEIFVNGKTKDFGYAFYCTNIWGQAAKWARSGNINPIVNKYIYTPDSTMRVLKFDGMTEEWLNFIALCRNGGTHLFDIVEGPMADDQIWDYVKDFLNGRITREAFWAQAKFRHPTHQIAFCTPRSLSCIKYRSYKHA